MSLPRWIGIVPRRGVKSPRDWIRSQSVYDSENGQAESEREGVRINDISEKEVETP